MNKMTVFIAASSKKTSTACFPSCTPGFTANGGSFGAKWWRIAAGCYYSLKTRIVNRTGGGNCFTIPHNTPMTIVKLIKIRSIAVIFGRYLL
jgi:hypothetical protein